MSVFAGTAHGDSKVNALIDPFSTISYTRILTEQYFDIIKKIFGEYMDPGIVCIPVKYNGKKENINMPGKIVIANKMTNSINFWQAYPFPLYFINKEKQHWFYFGNDIMQFVGSKNVYALSYYRNDIAYFSIVLINNNRIYVININSSEDEIQYYELDRETKNKMQKYISATEAYMMDYAYYELQDIFKKAHIVRSHKEKIEDKNLENIVKEILDKCISSPSHIIGKFNGKDLTNQSLTIENIIPGLKVEAKPNILRENSVQIIKITKDKYPRRFYKEEINNNEEFFVFTYPEAKFNTLDFLWWYAIIKKEKNENGKYQVSYYYYDAETITALEYLCASHDTPMPLLRFNDATNAGIIPCYITTRWFETLEEAKAEVEAYYNNPETIKTTNGYKHALVRSINKIREENSLHNDKA